MRPETEAALAENIAAARGPLRIVGGGTRDIGAPVAGELVETAGMSGITLYEPGALTLVAKAGTPLSEIEVAVAAENQRLAFEPMDHRGLLGTSGTSTIGGCVAANVSGPRRISVGACRDHMLGVRMVDGAGRILKNGGRVMKNVTGYDLVKLMSGSFGTLGVLTEVSLKVLPVAQTQATIILHDIDAVPAVEALSAGLGSPYEVTGAAYDPALREAYLRIEGFEDSVAYRTGELKKVLADFGEMSVADDVTLWEGIRDVSVFHGKEGDVWRISVRPSDAPAVLEAAGADAALLDWGGGLIWLRVAEGRDVRTALQGISGHATLVRASAQTRASLPVFHPEDAGVRRLSDALRAKFDPRGILNTGLMG
jgi:glycolate oxidase FAD binding subunit